MTIHGMHPHVYDPGTGNMTGPILADGCERCRELSASPWDIDLQRQAVLLARRGRQLSTNDTLAAKNLQVFLEGIGGPVE